jgi:hypothetical protein
MNLHLTKQWEQLYSIVSNRSVVNEHSPVQDYIYMYLQYFGSSKYKEMEKLFTS